VAQLTERLLLGEAGDLSFERGQDYVKYVVGLRVTGKRAHASIQAKRVYQCELDWAQKDIRCLCTCRFFDQGFFCKHLVAVGLAAIDAGHGSAGEGLGSESAELVAVLDDSEVRAVLVELADRDAGVRRAVELRAAARTGDVSALADELEGMVKQALAVRGHVDYRRSFGVARDAEQLLDELAAYLDAGSADAVAPALLRATTRLRKVVLQADDSSGLLGNAGQRAAEMYARACREGAPDAKKLARWLVQFRDSSPGWPQLELADFVEAFDGAALEAYRRGVAKLDESYADRDHYKRFEVDRMMLELADHDGDIDRAVELLTTRDHPQYGAVIDRLRAVGRDEEAIEWMDRAVAAGRVSGRMGGDEVWLDPVEVADTYRSLGRNADGTAVLREEFARRPELATFRRLVAYASQIGHGDAERSWALARALELAAAPYGDGALLIEIALSDGDLETAWSAARDLGPGRQWRLLADASRDFAPREAAELYRDDVGKDLKHADTQKYASIAERLAAMRDLYQRAGAEADFADYLAELRETYRRRTSFISALDRRGL
jgi:uncharacterized Zn finger protein